MVQKLSKQRLYFTKSHTCGNDFVILFKKKNKFTQNLLEKLADYKTGIGFDQLLLLTQHNSQQFFCEIYNKDSSKAKMCGNGMLSLAKYLVNKFEEQNYFIDVDGIKLMINKNIDNTFSVKIPLTNKASPKLKKIKYINKQLEIYTMSLGNEHAISFTNNLKTDELFFWANIIKQQSIFPQGINLSFVEKLTEQTLKIATFEKGVGLTRACGSAACVATITAFVNNIINSSKSKVYLPGGQLVVDYQEYKNLVVLSGQPKLLFDGILNLNEI